MPPEDTKRAVNYSMDFAFTTDLARQNLEPPARWKAIENPR